MNDRLTRPNADMKKSLNAQRPPSAPVIHRNRAPRVPLVLEAPDAVARGDQTCSAHEPSSVRREVLHLNRGPLPRKV